jgi:uncharacterized membrane protein YfcA
VLPILAFIASVVNGAIGYGFSSIITPVAVLFTTNKLLNPALVICELGVNITLLFWERRNIRNTWRRALPFAVGLLPGVIVGSLVLSLIAPVYVKMALYVTLFPLILAQLLGWQRPVKNEKVVSPFLGGAVGLLYSLTTISGPPLALYWRNQGLSKDDFRCVISQIRVAEASFTTISYAILGLFTSGSVALMPYIFLPVIVGIPLGIFMLRNLPQISFRRIVMGADGLLVLFGLTNVLGAQNYIPQTTGYLIFAAGAIVLIYLTAEILKRPEDYRLLAWRKPDSNPSKKRKYG